MRTVPSTYNAGDVNYDLHLHSSASDGALDPATLLSHAADCGVHVVSITDHDTLAAYDALEPGGLHVIPGIEFSTNWHDTGIHVLGLDIDPSSPTLRRGVVQQQAAREARAARIAARLQRLGIPDLLPAVREAVGNGHIGRPQFATQLVEKGIVRDIRSAYRKYLGRGKPGDVRNVWAPLDEVLQWIHAAGGTSALAHPAKYGLTKSKIRALARDFAACGGQALEVVCGPQTDATTYWLARLANELSLAASCGSDFHSPENAWSRPGGFPRLPDDVRPVWQAWRKTFR
jgi:predicted metal-dependent phosphoesterase TrpH